MIILYGHLRKKFGKFIDSNVKSVYELMKCGEALRPGFRSAIDRNRNYVIRRGDTFKKGVDVPEEEIKLQFNNENVWHVLPLPVGHKGGLFQFIAGAILTVVGVYFGQGWLVNIGVGMMLSGVASMLAPSPPVTNYTNREDPDKRPSYLFNGPMNRTEAGGAVPLVYGFDVFVGSIFTSGGIQIGDVS